MPINGRVLKYDIQFLFPHFTEVKKWIGCGEELQKLSENLEKGPCRKRLKGFSLLSLIKTSSDDFSDYNV